MVFMVLELAKAIHISAVIPAEQSVLSVLYEGLKHISLISVVRKVPRLEYQDRNCERFNGRHGRY